MLNRVLNIETHKMVKNITLYKMVTLLGTITEHLVR